MAGRTEEEIRRPASGPARHNTIIAVFGRKGLGKTYLVKFLVRGCRRMLLIDTMAEYSNGRIVYDIAVLYDIMTTQETFRIVFRPMSEEDFIFAVDLAINIGHMTLVIDEIDQKVNSYQMPEVIRWVIHYGRHFNLSVVMAARMPQRIRADITVQADVILSFQQQGRPTVAYLKDFADADAFEGKVKGLFEHEFIEVSGNFSVDNPPYLP